MRRRRDVIRFLSVLLATSGCGMAGHLGDQPVVRGTLFSVTIDDAQPDRATVVGWNRGAGFEIDGSVFFGIGEPSYYLNAVPLDPNGTFLLQLPGKLELGRPATSQYRFETPADRACASTPTVNPPTLGIATLRLGLRGPDKYETIDLTALPNRVVEFVYSDVDGTVSGTRACGGSPIGGSAEEFNWNLRAGWNVIITTLPLPVSVTMRPEYHSETHTGEIPKEAIWHTSN